MAEADDPSQSGNPEAQLPVSERERTKRFAALFHQTQLSVGKVASGIGVHRSYVGAILRGEKEPSKPVVLALEHYKELQTVDGAALKRGLAQALESLDPKESAELAKAIVGTIGDFLSARSASHREGAPHAKARRPRSR